VAQTVDGPTPAGEQAASGASPAAVTAPAGPVTAPPAPPTPPTPPTEPEAPESAPGREPRLARARPAQRRTRVTVRNVGPLSVLKFSLIFYFCVMTAVLLGLMFLFMILQAVGAIDAVEELITKFFVQDDGGTFQIQPGYLLPRLFLIGCGMVVVWSFINLLVAFLYNLISDVVGGVEITLAEKK
jgi:transmembrane protein DUF3566